MSETQRASGLDLARQFYQAHEIEFQRAVQANSTKERGFEFSGDRFDKWAVAIDELPRTAEDCVEGIERGGLTVERNKLRNRLNTAARAGIGLPRAFSVEASHKKWRVVLAERFLAERPQEIVKGIGTRLDYDERRLGLTRRLLEEEADHLSDPEKAVLLMQLDNVAMYVFNAAQLHELILRRAFDPEYKKLDLRRLRKRMSRLLQDEPERQVVRRRGGK